MYNRMPVLLSIIGLFATALLGFARVPSAHAAEARVMSYNIKCAPNDETSNWGARKENLVADIRATMPDLLGLQEALKNQLDFIAGNLPEYAWIGVARDDGRERGEYCPILYRTELYEVVESGTFWLSETPDIPGKKGWGAACNRIVTWGKFRRRANGREFIFACTHFDHVSETARRESAKLVLKFKEEKAAGLPFIITGDFNSTDTTQAYQAMTQELKDARKMAESRKGGEFTFPSEKMEKQDERVIDYFFVSDEVGVREFSIHSNPPKHDPMPSDHFSIDAVLEF